MSLPAGVTTGVVTGTFATLVAGASVPVDGMLVVFKPSAPVVLDAGASQTLAVAPVTGVVRQGILYDTSGAVGVTLVGTDSAGINPTGFTWQVTFLGAPPIGFTSFSFALPGGTTRDLATLSPVPPVSFVPSQVVTDGTVGGYVTAGGPTQAALDGRYAPKTGSATYETQAHAAATYQAAAALDTATAGEVNTPASATVAALNKNYLPTTPVAASRVTQGLYARTVPAPSGESSITALCTDPNNAGYLWALGATSGKIGYSPDNGATFNALVANPSGGQAIVQAIITTNWFFILTTGTTSKAGQVWRSPSPNTTGSNVAFTKVFDLTGLVNGPGGAVASGPSNSSFRVGCMAVQPDESRMYLLTYGAGNDALALGGGTDGMMSAGVDMLYSPAGSGAFTGVTGTAAITVNGAGAAGSTLTTTIAEIFSTKKVRLVDCAQTDVTAATFNVPSQTYGSQAVIGGPFFYVSSNIGNATASAITFTNTKFWSFAKHGHAVKIIGGVPWVSLGDYPWPVPYSAQAPTTHVGFHAATDATGTSWNQKTSAGAINPYDGINFLPVSIGGAPMLIAESDNKFATGPIIVPTQSNAAGTVPVIVPFTTYLPHIQTMRSICLTAEGNLMWYGTGESGGVGPTDGIWMAATPFTRPFLLEQLASGTISAQNEAIALGAYVWIGNNRIAREKFIGQ